jgi:thioredoxin 1
MIYNITDEGELKFNGLTVVKFKASWCKPCSKMDTVLAKMEKEFPEVNLFVVDIDEFLDLARKYKIMGVPNLLFFNGNKEVSRVEGLMSTEAIRKVFKLFVENC